MILFNSMEAVVAFLEKKLPEKIKKNLFYETGSGGSRYRRKLPPYFVIQELRKHEIIIGITNNPENFAYPEKYALHWSRLQKILSASDNLLIEQEKYSLISINTACKILGVTRPTVYKIINDNKIPYVDILSQKRIQLSDLLDFIEQNKKYK
jgi:excisionase family DNA binding protein